MQRRTMLENHSIVIFFDTMYLDSILYLKTFKLELKGMEISSNRIKNTENWYNAMSVMVFIEWFSKISHTYSKESYWKV